jgi:hypothetical protein
MADWNAIIDGLVKPTFDGVLALPDLGRAVTEARAAALPDPRQAALKRKIAEMRTGYCELISGGLGKLRIFRSSSWNNSGAAGESG